MENENLFRKKDWLVNKTDKYYKSIEDGNENLKSFARKVIRDVVFAGDELDAGDIQELAENCGLIIKKIATDDDVDGEFCDFDIGDFIFVFSDILKESK